MLYINSNEPKRLAAILTSKLDARTTNFWPGDYVFANTGIERKSYPDFLGSIKSRRLFIQLLHLKKNYLHAYLIVEMPFLEGIVNLNSIYRVIIYLQQQNIKVLFSTSEEHTAQIIILLYAMMQRDNRAFEGNILRNKPVKMSIYERQMLILMGFPGIGRCIAKQLLKRFGSLKKVFAAPEKRLLGTKGIGRAKAAGMKELLNLKRKNKQDKN